jgi:tRNA pseudouridine32 synthase/23S rRNA pseudouridine746 synthase
MKALPLIDGVGPSRVAVPLGDWPNALAFLTQRFPGVSKQEWAERFSQGLVLDAQGQALQADDACPSGKHVLYYRRLQEEPPLSDVANILFEDAHLLVADKPHFMPVTPAGRYLHNSLLVRLKQQTQCAELTPIHRIDRETAGLVVFCKRPQDRNAYHALFRERQIDKRYEAVAPWREDLIFPMVQRCRLEEDSHFFLSKVVDGAPNSETLIRLLKQRNGVGLYALEPHTGRRHQLRLHMLSLGLPILGDQFYPTVLRGPDEADDFSQPLQLLAKELAFQDPVTGARRCWTSQQQLQQAW